MFFINNNSYNKNLKICIFISLLLFMNTGNICLSKEKSQKLDNVEVQGGTTSTTVSEQGIGLNLDGESKQTIKISDPVKKFDGKLVNKAKEQQAFRIQKEMDVEDIRTLWGATIERNTVIKFAVKKLSMPPETRRIHSSLMAKSLSGLVGGVAFLPNLLGADGFTSTASSAAGRIISRLIAKKTIPKEVPLTDSELLQLAAIIDELQNRLIKSYYDYKSSIEALKVCRQNIMLQNVNYSNSLKSGDGIAIIASSALYDKELLDELKLKQQIKIHRLELERLAGAKVVDELNLGKISVLDEKEDSQEDKNSAFPAQINENIESGEKEKPLALEPPKSKGDKE